MLSKPRMRVAILPEGGRVRPRAPAPESAAQPWRRGSHGRWARLLRRPSLPALPDLRWGSSVWRRCASAATRAWPSSTNLRTPELTTSGSGIDRRRPCGPRSSRPRDKGPQRRAQSAGSGLHPTIRLDWSRSQTGVPAPGRWSRLHTATPAYTSTSSSIVGRCATVPTSPRRVAERL